jgi:muramoyltetrapeptide carboxypeptidase
MPTLPTLKAGDCVEIIAPASRVSDQQLQAVKELLASWQLNCIVADDIFGDDLLCANSDEIRFKHLKNALEHPKTKAVICARGGYGSMRLIPELMKITPPAAPKLFVGMSDITALHLFLQQHWQWPTLHGALALDKFSAESIAQLKSILLGETQHITWQGVPLNAFAKENKLITTAITGGNLSLVQNSIGTAWQINGRDKIVFLEDIGERAYKLDRMLEHLQQAQVFEQASGILLGDFMGGEEPNGSSLIEPVLTRFANRCKIPVVKINGVGHGPTSFALPLGATVNLQLGDEVKLS